MPKAPSPWNRDCRRQPTDFGSDDPTIALSEQKARKEDLAGSDAEPAPRSTAVALALALGVGAIISVIVVAVIAAFTKPGAGT